jgi:hypothetical protein
MFIWFTSEIKDTTILPAWVALHEQHLNLDWSFDHQMSLKRLNFTGELSLDICDFTHISLIEQHVLDTYAGKQ